MNSTKVSSDYASWPLLLDGSITRQHGLPNLVTASTWGNQKIGPGNHFIKQSHQRWPWIIRNPFCHFSDVQISELLWKWEHQWSWPLTYIQVLTKNEVDITEVLYKNEESTKYAYVGFYTCCTQYSFTTACLGNLPGLRQHDSGSLDGAHFQIYHILMLLFILCDESRSIGA